MISCVFKLPLSFPSDSRKHSHKDCIEKTWFVICYAACAARGASSEQSMLSSYAAFFLPVNIGGGRDATNNTEVTNN
jgi:hypothetical protein